MQRYLDNVIFILVQYFLSALTFMQLPYKNSAVFSLILLYHFIKPFNLFICDSDANTSSIRKNRRCVARIRHNKKKRRSLAKYLFVH